MSWPVKAMILSGACFVVCCFLIGLTYANARGRPSPGVDHLKVTKRLAGGAFYSLVAAFLSFVVWILRL